MPRSIPAIPAGPLLDSAGRLIGINTAIYSPSGASAGVGFAVPVDTVNRVVAQLIDTGHYAPPSLGIETDETLSRVIARRLGVVGVAVARVPGGSAGAKAGLRGIRQGTRGQVTPGDVITAINGKSVDSVARLLAVLDDYKPGTTVKVSLWREGKNVDVQATLQVGDAGGD